MMGFVGFGEAALDALEIANLERDYNFDIKNPHIIEDDQGDRADLLAKLNESERQAASLRDQLKAILAEALLK